MMKGGSGLTFGHHPDTIVGVTSCSRPLALLADIIIIR